MIVAVIVLLLALVSYIGYKCFTIYRVRKRMDWIAHVPGWPVLGNALEFGDTTGKQIYKNAKFLKECLYFCQQKTNFPKIIHLKEL